MRRLLLLAPLVFGCHAKFKHHVDEIGGVRPQVIATTGPYVQLGMVHDDSIVAAIINVVQSVNSVPVAQRLAEAVDVGRVNTAFEQGLRDTLGAGPPFAVVDEADASLLQIDVVAYGLMVPSLGSQGLFTYNLTPRIYLPDGERVYTASVDCATAVGSPEPAAAALFVIDNLSELEQMTDAEIQASFEAAARWCGAEVVRKIRKHAG